MNEVIKKTKADSILNPNPKLLSIKASTWDMLILSRLVFLLFLPIFLPSFLSLSLFSLLISFQKDFIEYELKRLTACVCIFCSEHFWENYSVREKFCGFGIQPCRLAVQQGHWRTINWAYKPILPESFLNFEFRVSRHVSAANQLSSFSVHRDFCPK